MINKILTLFKKKKKKKVKTKFFQVLEYITAAPYKI